MQQLEETLDRAIFRVSAVNGEYREVARICPHEHREVAFVEENFSDVHKLGLIAFRFEGPFNFQSGVKRYFAFGAIASVHNRNFQRTTPIELTQEGRNEFGNVA